MKRKPKITPLSSRRKKKLPRTFTVEGLHFSGKEVAELEKKFGLKNLRLRGFDAMCKLCDLIFGYHDRSECLSGS